VRWEMMFTHNAAGAVAAGRTVHLQLNIQRHVHTGPANDHRFRGLELAMVIPISNTISRRPNRVRAKADWSAVSTLLHSSYRQLHRSVQ